MSRKRQENNINKEKENLSLLDLILKEREKGENVITGILSIRPPEDMWRGLIALPPSTLLEDIVAEFDKKSNIPLELPFFTFFHYLAALLLQKSVTLHVNDITIRPDIWTVLLAESGAGKTFTNKQLQFGIPDLRNLSFDIGGIASTAKFIDMLQDNNNKMLFRDEFAEMYKQINNAAGPMSEMKDTMLRLYNNDDIIRMTKKEEISIINAAVVFFAVTVKEILSRELTADDLINGFAQRFSFLIAPKDPKKDFINYPLWEINTKGWQEKWEDLVRSIKYTTYCADSDAIDAFKTSFTLLVNRNIDESFYRRQLWKANKYALIYHILLGRGNDQKIKSDCYGWAARLVGMLLYDCMQLLQEHGLSDIETKIRKVEKLRERLAAKKQEITLRSIVQNIRDIKTIAEAKAILDLILHRR
jgi:hypothetical protein